jgi:endonuclease/exonuclease/phosphatase family metal-dependent hydrolase
VKLIQLNIWQGKILLAVSRFLQAQDADIVCLQEVFSSTARIPLLDFFSSLEQLQDELHYPFVSFAPTYEFNPGGFKVKFGNAILSKYPIKNEQIIFTNNQLQVVKDWATERPPNTRSAIICTVETPSGDLHLATHHGYHEFDPLGSTATVEKMQVLVDRLKPLQGPLIVAGDFNITPGSEAMRLYDGWLEDLTATHHLTDTLTEFGKVREVPCDHILISGDIKVTSFEVSRVLVSDHTPLVMEFSL